MPAFRVILIIAFLWLSATAHANVLVLVHGYFSGEQAWQQSGVTEELEKAGWRAGGRYLATSHGVQLLRQGATVAQPVYYLADLPSEASMVGQASLLHYILVAIGKRHPNEDKILIGHSVGGVVSRLTMVRYPEEKIQGLITIASPHLGTDKAEIAGFIASTPMVWVAPILGAGTLTRSQQLYAELIRERPGSLLFWLNRQQHPQAHYVSICRKEGFTLGGDHVVPSWSQDMGRVVALQNRTQMLASGSSHQLERQDGKILVHILRDGSKSLPGQSSSR